MRNKIIVIIGPTAAGKTSLAIKLARRINGEIISADSMQVYKGMDVTSQKPSIPQLRKAKHYFISALKPSEEYSAAIFSKEAKKTIKNIIKRGKIPIIAGGSGLYIKALIEGVFPSKGKNAKLRKKLREIYEEKGKAFLHERLSRVDPEAAKKIHPNDVKKVIRALEICETEKNTKTNLREKTKGIKGEYDILMFGLRAERARLYDAINKRVDKMFSSGIVKEVEKLAGSRLSLTAGQALGIKEIKGFLEENYSLQDAKELLKRNTRRFAKRQFTWFNADKRIVWLDMDKLSEKRAVETITDKL